MERHRLKQDFSHAAFSYHFIDSSPSSKTHVNRCMMGLKQNFIHICRITKPRNMSGLTLDSDADLFQIHIHHFFLENTWCKLENSLHFSYPILVYSNITFMIINGNT